MRQEFSNPTKSARTLSAPGHLLDDLSGGHGCHIGTSHCSTSLLLSIFPASVKTMLQLSTSSVK